MSVLSASISRMVGGTLCGSARFEKTCGPPGAIPGSRTRAAGAPVNVSINSNRAMFCKPPRSSKILKSSCLRPCTDLPCESVATTSTVMRRVCTLTVLAGVGDCELGGAFRRGCADGCCAAGACADGPARAAKRHAIPAKTAAWRIKSHPFERCINNCGAILHESQVIGC